MGRFQHQFARALRQVRKVKGLTQEDFSSLSSRTYVSALERGMKSPTLTKVNELAAILSIHPLTLLVLSYVQHGEPAAISELLREVESESRAIALNSEYKRGPERAAAVPKAAKARRRKTGGES